MRYFAILTLFLGIVSPAFSQSKTSGQFVKHQIERLKEEKIKIENLSEALEFWKQNPGMAFQEAIAKNSELHASSRSGDGPVHDDDMAESEVHAAINPADSNNVIVSAIIQDPDNLFEALKVPVYYTTDFGSTWKTGATPATPAAFTLGGGDPVVAFDRSGKAYLSWLILGLEGFTDAKIALYLASSSDKGKTWTMSSETIDEESLDIAALLGGGAAKFVDKQWMAVDQNEASPNEGNLYVSYTWLNQIDSANGEVKIFLKTKKKNSSSFGNRVQVHTYNYGVVQFSSVDVDREGNVHVIFFGGDSEEDLFIYHAMSSDGGLTFAPETKVGQLHFPYILQDAPEDEISGVDPTRLYPCPHIKSGKTPGTLFVTWTADGVSEKSTAGFDIYFSKSTDYGQNWTDPTIIYNDGNDQIEQFYPAMSVNTDGVLAVSYYDRSDDITGAETHHVVTFSKDDGATFSSPTVASSVPSNFENIGDSNGGFGIGEYTAIVTTKSRMMPVWSDGRSNDGDIDIYAASLDYDLPISSPEVGTVTDVFFVSGPNPNPVQGKMEFTINLERPTDLNLKIVNHEGKLIWSEESLSRMPTGKYDRKVFLAPGTYVLTVETEFGFSSKKVIVQ